MVTYGCTEMMSDDWKEFVEEVYEVAFGDSAFDRGFDAEEVLNKIKEFSDNALKWEEHTGND